MTDIGSGLRKEVFRTGNAFIRIGFIVGQGVKMIWQFFDLINIENAVGFKKRYKPAYPRWVDIVRLMDSGLFIQIKALGG